MVKVYVAGKVAKDSEFKTHYWRSDFLKTISEMTGVEYESLDPTQKTEKDATPLEIFNFDVKLISECDLFIVYLSDDISVGGSQEILVARYLNKPVIGFAPRGGKFNGARREMFGKLIEDYKDPFVFTTCDVVAGDINELAIAVQNYKDINSSGLGLIDDAVS